MANEYKNDWGQTLISAQYILYCNISDGYIDRGKGVPGLNLGVSLFICLW